MRVTRKRPYKRLEFIVSFNRPKGASITECTDYIYDSIRSWKGGLRPPLALDDDDPGDPMWGLEPDSVTVRHSRKGRRIS